MAQTYVNYLRDISSLKIEATCQVSTNVPSDPLKMAAPINQNLYYMFGRTEAGDRIYWSAVDPSDRSGYAQSFWANVEFGSKDEKASATKIVNIIGALPWLNRPLLKHYIYLFVDAKVAGEREVLYIRLDLDHYEPNATWKGEMQVLEIRDVPMFPNTPLAVNLLDFFPHDELLSVHKISQA